MQARLTAPTAQGSGPDAGVAISPMAPGPSRLPQRQRVHRGRRRAAHSWARSSWWRLPSRGGACRRRRSTSSCAPGGHTIRCRARSSWTSTFATAAWRRPCVRCRNRAGTSSPGACWYFDHTTMAVREIPLDLPANLEPGEESRTVVIEGLSKVKVSAQTTAPDGYKLENSTSGSPGIVGDLFGIRTVPADRRPRESRADHSRRASVAGTSSPTSPRRTPWAGWSNQDNADVDDRARALAEIVTLARQHGLSPREIGEALGDAPATPASHRGHGRSRPRPGIHRRHVRVRRRWRVRRPAMGVDELGRARRHRRSAPVSPRSSWP